MYVTIYVNVHSNVHSNVRSNIRSNVRSNVRICIERDSIPDQLEFDINIIKKIHINVELIMNQLFSILKIGLKLFTEEAFFHV